LVLATAEEGKPMLSCYISKEVADKKLNAGQVVRELEVHTRWRRRSAFFATAGRKKRRRYSRSFK
jgi:alanyl-tRNA synthetase